MYYSYSDFISVYGCENTFLASVIQAIEDSDIDVKFFGFEYDGRKIIISADTEEDADKMYDALYAYEDEGYVYNISSKDETTIEVKNMLK